MTRRTAVRDPWVWGQALLGALVLVGVPMAARRWGILDPNGVTRWLGAEAVGLGLVVLALGAATLGPNLTPGTQPLPTGRLVTRGIYRIVRHPIYLGVSLLLAGYALLRAGWWAGGLTLLGSLAYFEQKARAEERWLTRLMPDYEAYRAQVPRILPGGWH